MAGFAAFLPYITTGLAVAQTVAQGRAQEQIANIQDDQQNQQALADQAASVLSANQERRKARYLQSRAIALAGKSGTATESPDIQNIISDIGGRGEYNALAALYSGASSASSKRYAASLSRSQGQSAKNASYIDSASTVLGSYDQLAKRKGWYG